MRAMHYRIFLVAPIFLLCLKSEIIKGIEVECDWSIARYQCPLYGTTDWECLKTRLGCSNGEQYHCVRNGNGSWMEVCGQEKICGKGEEPTYSKDLGIHCQPCSNQERFEPLENTPSYTYSECRRKKNACPVGVSVECPNASDKYSQNRKCRCMYEMEFIPQGYDMARDTWRCADPEDLNCVQETCPETADGRKQFRGPDYRCSPTLVPPPPTPTKTPALRPSTVAYKNYSTTTTKDEGEEGAGVPIGLIIAIIIALITVLVCCLVYIVHKKLKKTLSPPLGPLEAMNIRYTELTLSWSPPKIEEGYLPTEYLLERQEMTLSFWHRIGMISAAETEYRVKELKAGTAYHFQVIAKYKKGRSKPLRMQESVKTKEITRPDKPQKFSGSFDRDNNCIKMSWEPPDDDGGKPLLAYRIDYCNAVDNEWVEADVVSAKIREWTKCDLIGGSQYNFRICAKNEKGFGAVEELQASIKFLSVPGKPMDIKVEIPRDQSDRVNVYWKAPEKNGGLDIQWYHIRKKEANSDWDHESITIVRGSVMTQRVINLTPEKSYFFGVCAENKMGKGDFVDTDEPVTLPKRKGPPDPVRSLEASEIGYTDLILSWQPPEYSGGFPVMTYLVVKKQEGLFSWRDEKKVSAEETKHHVRGLKDGTEYYFQVSAKNERGGSKPVETKVCTKDATRPGTPVGPVIFSNITAKTVTLCWKQPKNDGGSEITGYHIEYIDSQTETIRMAAKSNKTTTFTQKNLCEDCEYVFYISAINAKGQSAETLVSESVKPKKNAPKDVAEPERNTPTKEHDIGTSVDKDLPGQPVNLDFSVKGSNLIITWEPPRYDGGPEILKYHVSCVCKQDNDWQKIAVVEAPKTKCTIENLSAGIKYYFRIWAENKNGNGNVAENAAPIVLHQEKGFFRKSLRLDSKGDFDSGLQSGGRSLKSPQKSSEKDDSSPTPESVTVKEHFKLEEKEKLLGAEARVIVKPGKPSAPLPPMQCTDITHNSVELSWNPSATDGGSVITRYEIDYKTKRDTSWQQAMTQGPATVFCVTKLEENTEYWFRVRAVNEAGSSDALESEQSIKTKKKKLPPGPPEDFTVSPLANNTVTLRWRAPTDDGGSKLTGFIIVVRKKDNDDWTFSEELEHWDITFTMRNLPYTSLFFSIAAKNANGTSKAVETKEPLTLKDPTVPPSSPVGPLQATNVDATELTLSWQAPEFNGESPITSYFLHYFTMKPERSEWEFLAQIPANQTMYHVKGLKEKTEYCFSIKAVNEWGPSEPLEMKKPVETKILKVPMPPVGPVVISDVTENSARISWKPPSSNLSSVTGYIIEYKDKISTFTDAWTIAGSVTRDKTTLVQTGLKEGHEYAFRIFGVNAKGYSEPLNSEPLFIPERETGAPDKPERIMIMDIIDKSQVKLTWNPPVNDGGKEIKQYHVFMKCNNSNMTSIGHVTASQRSFLTDKLAPGDYYFGVCAENDIGCGDCLETSSPTVIEKPEKSNGAERREIKGAEGDVDKADQKADYADDLEKERKARQFLELLQSIISWEDFVKTASGIRPLLKGSLVIPKEPASQFTHCREYKERLKCDRLPDPLKVFETSDNENSLFRSISILLFGNENCTYRLRLAAVEDGLTNCSTYITHVQQFARLSNLTIGNFMEAVLSEKSRSELDKARKDDLNILKEFTMQMVIRETAMPESRCNTLQVQFLSSATGFPIVEYYEAGSIGFYGKFNEPLDTIKPLGKNAEKEKKDHLNIVWISDPLLSRGVKNKINRVLPLSIKKKK